MRHSRQVKYTRTDEAPISSRRLPLSRRQPTKRQSDIAVDLGGYSRDSRSGIALRAAPIQVSYLGTVGCDFIDYLIADPMLVPQESRRHYSEKIAYLPSYEVTPSPRAWPQASSPPRGCPSTSPLTAQATSVSPPTRSVSRTCARGLR